MELVDDFASNCDLDDRARESIKTWLRKQAKLGNFRNVFDQERRAPAPRAPWLALARVWETAL